MSEAGPTSPRTPVRAALSRLAGRVAGSRASRGLIPWFARHYGVDQAAALVPAGGFQSLQQFFTRALRPGLRPLSPASGLLAPVDGTVGACGTIERGQLLQAKGRRYGLAGLLADPAAAGRFEGGLYCTLYLAPGDYHRIHAPASGTLVATRRVPGTFHPVNPRAVAAVPGLFAANERIIVELDCTCGRIALAMVGACLVGSIQIELAPPCALDRGQELARFAFGSTVIVLAPPAARLRLAVAAGERVLMGGRLMVADGPSE